MPTPVTSNAGSMQRLQRFMEAFDKAPASPQKPREAAGHATGNATEIDQLDDVRPSPLTAVAHQALLRDVFPDLSSGRPVDAGCMADEMRGMQQLLKGMESLGCPPAKGPAVLEVMQQLIGALEAASCRAPTLPPIKPPPAGGAFVEPQPKVSGVYFENRVPDRRVLDPLRLTFEGFEDGSHIAVRVRSNLGEVFWQELPSKAFEGRSRDGRLPLELGPDTLQKLGCRGSDPRKDGVQAGEQLDIVVVRPGRLYDFHRMLTSADGLATIQKSAQRLHLQKPSDGTRLPSLPASDVVDIGTIERPRGSGPVALGDASVPQVDTRSLKVAHDGERFQLAAALNSLGEGTFMEPRATVMPFERMGYSDAITRRSNDLDGEHFHGAPVARKAFQRLTSDAEGASPWRSSGRKRTACC